MAVFFMKLVHMSIAASWLILAVILLRLLLRRAPKWINCILWGMVAIRLVCPFSFESQFSLVPNTQTINSAMVRYSPETIANREEPMAAWPVDLSAAGESVPVMGTDAGADSLDAWMNAAGIIWLIGLGCLLGYALFGYFRLRRNISEAVFLQDNIWIGDRVKSPFILGIIRPRIYLSSGTEESQIGYILAHEQAHIRRRDHWWKLLGYLLLMVYWFNPLSWVAYILLCQDIELACDEKVIRGLEEEEKRAYSFALLNCSTQRRVVLACPPAFGEVGVMQRVKSVLHYKKPAFWVVLIAVLACLAVAVCFLTTSPRTYPIRVTIPAEGTEYFYYSDAEISPKGNTLTLYAGEGMGDGEIRLLPVEVREERAYDEPIYITQGMPVKIEVEKGAWYRIGVNSGQNVSGEERDVYVLVSNVDIRIEDKHAQAGADAQADADMQGKAEEQTGADAQGKTEKQSGADAHGNAEEQANVDFQGEADMQTGAGTQEELISATEAKRILQQYLSAAGQWNEDYVIEPLDPVEGRVEDTRAYRFEVRYGDAVEQMNGRLVGNYAVADDGRAVYEYDFVNDAFNRMQEVGEDMGQNTTGTTSNAAVPFTSAFPIKFLFASGASSAGTTLTLNQDGSFTGQHYDHENVRGDGYPKGMCYICDFNGQFEDAKQINAYTYSLMLGEITTEREEGEQWIEDEQLMIASKPYGLEDGKEFLLYMPGTPLEELSEEFLSWWMGGRSYRNNEENPQILPCYGLLNTVTGKGFFCYE